MPPSSYYYKQKHNKMNSTIKDYRKKQSQQKSLSQSLPAAELRKRLHISPSPAQYKLKSIFDLKKGFSIPHNQENNRKLEGKPNPWTYYPTEDYVKSKSPKATIGKEKRHFKQQQGPSPANYQTNYNTLFPSSRRPVFGKSKRQDLHMSTMRNPGPSDYDTIKSNESMRKNRFATIGNQTKIQKFKANIPAPNQYQNIASIDVNVKNKKGFSIGKKIRVKSQNCAPLDYFKYNTNRETTLPKSPAFSMPKDQKRQSQHSISPGPGLYVEAKLSPKGFTMGKSARKLHEIVTNPGPEVYSARLQVSSPGYSMPKAKLQNSNLFRVNPGPADYSPQLPESQKHRSVHIGSGDRSNLSLGKDKIPGPGDYNLQFMRKKGLMIGKDNKMGKTARTGPGPADYFIDFGAIKKFILKKKKD